MRGINKLILKKIIEIVFVLGFVVYSYGLWQNESLQNNLKTAKTYANNNYTYMLMDNPINYTMYKLADNEAIESLKPCTIKIINETYTTENYALILKIPKEISSSFFNISIDGNIMSLNSLEKNESENFNEHIIDKNTIAASNVEYEIKIWLNATAKEEIQGTNLKAIFELTNGNTVM